MLVSKYVVFRILLIIFGVCRIIRHFGISRSSIIFGLSKWRISEIVLYFFYCIAIKCISMYVCMYNACNVSLQASTRRCCRRPPTPAERRNLPHFPLIPQNIYCTHKLPKFIPSHTLDIYIFNTKYFKTY